MIEAAGPGLDKCREASMNASSKRYLTAFAATAVLALGLYGCGGGGGSSPMTGDPMPDPEPMPDPTLDPMPDPGDGMATELGDERLTASPLASPEASSSADTLASFVDSGTLFGPVVSPIKNIEDDMGNSGLVLLEQGDPAAYVESITVEDSQGRFTMVYIVNDQKAEVEFGPEHLFGEDQIHGHYKWYLREINNIQFNIWYHPTFSNLVPVERQYFQLFDWATGDSRGFASAGILTGPDRLTSLGSATYEGQMVADWWNNFRALNLDDDRVRIWGALTLEADFIDGSIEGEIADLWAEPPGTAYTNCCWEQMSSATSIEILPGNVTGNRLHAEWEGRDTRTSPEPQYTVLGTSGSLLGEFYGPNGEEVGGVITGQRESTNQLMNGVFGANRQ